MRPARTTPGADDEFLVEMMRLATCDDRDPEQLHADLLAACATRLGLRGASLFAIGPGGRLVLLAAAGDGARVLALLEQHLQQGPSLDAARSGTTVGETDPDGVRRRWPGLVSELEYREVSSVYGVPVRDRAGEEAVPARCARCWPCCRTAR